MSLLRGMLSEIALHGGQRCNTDLHEIIERQNFFSDIFKHIPPHQTTSIIKVMHPSELVGTKVN